MLTFQEEGHIYRWGKRIVPSVTTVLGGWIEIASKGPRWFVDPYSGALVSGKVMDEAGDMGRGIHKGVKYILEGGVDWEALDPSLVAPLKEFGKFARDHNLKIQFVEQPMYSIQFDFAGTPDIAGFVDGSKDPCIIDVKGGDPGNVGPQASGYEILYREKTKRPRSWKVDRYCLELPKNGDPYDFYPLENKDDEAYFHAKLFAYKYDQKRRA